MRHDAHGYWVAEAGQVEPAAPLHGDVAADFLIVGGGYTGLWAALSLLDAAPAARVVVLEASRCGLGPSGRNGGFVNSYWYRLAELAAGFGDDDAVRVCELAGDAVDAVGAWAADRGADVWFRKGGQMKVATSPAQDGRWAPAVAACERLGHPEEYRALSAAEVRSRCESPLFGHGSLMAQAATVQPARLVLALREAVLAAGATLCEASAVRRLADGPDGVVAETGSGRVCAGAAVVAVGAAAAGLAPLRPRLAVTSTHMVVTEPVPDVLEDVGWTGGEGISSAQTYLNYLRTTPDGRIAFGWGGGRVAYGARIGGRVEVDPKVVERVRSDLLAMFPGLRGRRIEHAWGGPVDVSPNRLPIFGTLPGGSAHYALGFTGNGVGPCHLAGRVLASMALDRRDELTSLALVEPDLPPVPPEPARFAGGTAVRAAMLRRQELEDAGLEPGPLVDAVADLPARLGFHVGR